MHIPFSFIQVGGECLRVPTATHRSSHLNLLSRPTSTRAIALHHGRRRALRFAHTAPLSRLTTQVSACRGYNLFRMVLTKPLLLVAVRNQVSTLKHNIRQQQAQLNTLENIVRSGPRPYWPEIISDNHNDMQATASSSSTPPSSYAPGTSTSTKVKRRSSHDVLLSLAGPESHIPLPKREPGEENGIREGIPSNYPPNQTSFKRTPSPTRTLSRASSLYLYKATKNSCTRFPSRDTRVISR